MEFLSMYSVTAFSPIRIHFCIKSEYRNYIFYQEIMKKNYISFSNANTKHNHKQNFVARLFQCKQKLIIFQQRHEFFVSSLKTCNVLSFCFLIYCRQLWLGVKIFPCPPDIINKKRLSTPGTPPIFLRNLEEISST